MDERDVTLNRVPPRHSADWVDAHGRTYDAVGGFDGRHLDRQWDTFVGQIRRHLGKADFVPVDVSRFSAEQVRRIEKVVEPLSPRVFIVGK